MGPGNLRGRRGVALLLQQGSLRALPLRGHLPGLHRSQTQEVLLPLRPGTAPPALASGLLPHHLLQDGPEGDDRSTGAGPVGSRGPSDRARQASPPGSRTAAGRTLRHPRRERGVASLPGFPPLLEDSTRGGKTSGAKASLRGRPRRRGLSERSPGGCRASRRSEPALPEASPPRSPPYRTPNTQRR